MSRRDYRTLINLGRKSGLNTAEIYTALTTRPPQAGDTSGADSNGYVQALDSEGHRVFKPQEEARQ